ncbi:hypothetical protein ACG33_04445 [Steroidobacter denitrificans]|uniref:HTH araC/xylS-type domain-containing protein n=1 Tax=Steroidobacter denitrificans TaxID=465721 RepID=A0A127F7I9_STEDE|nr:AraC family transcriptional regulator [Steroidobacter denitrificans]AMN46367.1 hypothetical protein ACG33_04445 [Steroidobacter denitrificans]
MHNQSVHIHFVRVTLANARAQHLDTDALLARCGIFPQLLQLEDARVNARQFADLQTAVMRAMEDEFLGYGARAVRLGSWSVLCHWLIHSRFLGQTIKRFCHFHALMERGFDARLRMTKNTAAVEVAPWATSNKPSVYGYELFLFTFHRLLCWMTREKVPIKRMNLPYPMPGHHREYQYMFRGCPVYFDQDSCSISFQRSLLALPVRQNPASLAEFLRQPMYEIIVQDYDRSSWTARVRELIAHDPAGAGSLSEIARRLGTNDYSLRRRLAKEGYAFIDLKREVKRDLAIHLLARHRHSVEEIAFKTGFSEASAFIRAFKQWTGVTPRTYRKESRR